MRIIILVILIYKKKENNEISLIDPFELGNFADKYNKERLDNQYGEK